MVDAPTGTVTFLFTDIEGSTRLWEEAPVAMRDALAHHDAIVRDAIESNRGHVVKQTGDGFHAVFSTASDAVAAALAAQLAVEQEPWAGATPVRVRMGIHTGETHERGGDYYGSTTNRAARLMSVAHGGQIVMSDVTAGVVSNNLPDEAEVIALGAHRLRGFTVPVAVFQVTAAGLTDDFPPLDTLDARAGNLPAPVSSFVGREDELVQVRTLLDSARIVTLTGVGGVGKTRLALEVAAAVQPKFRDGVWLVELAQVRDPDAVAETIATALRTPDKPGVPVADAVAEFLQSRRLLLVLDNCEHVLDPVADLVRALERACPELVVLATSREGLGISGEENVAVRSLSLDESMQLFARRATAVRSEFELTDANSAAVGEVCRRLDGIPLALELAAARVAVLTPSQIRDRLDQRFRLLAGGERGAVERHATLRAAIDWSYDLLTAEEQLTLGRLSVFAGGCTLDAADAVCAGGLVAAEDILDLLAKLVTRSLVVADTTDEGDTRYRLLETIRQYAEEHLAPSDLAETRDRHARYYAEWIWVARGGLESASQPTWFQRVDREAENLRFAVNWAVERADCGVGCALVAAAARPVLFRVPAGRALLESAAPLLEVVRRTDPDRIAITAAGAAVVAALALEFDRAAEYIDDALAHATGPDDPAVAHAVASRGYVVMARGDVRAGLEDAERFLAWVRLYGTDFEVSWALSTIAGWFYALGDEAEARAVAEEALETARRSGAPSLLYASLVALAQSSIDGDPDAARAYVREAMTLQDVLGSFAEDAAIVSLIGIAARLDETDIVLRAASQILATDPAEALFVGVLLESLALAIARQRPEQAAAFNGAVDALAPGLVQIEMVATMRAHTADALAASLSPDVIERVHDDGRRLSAREATDLARTVIDEMLSD